MLEWTKLEYASKRTKRLPLGRVHQAGVLAFLIPPAVLLGLISMHERPEISAIAPWMAVLACWAGAGWLWAHWLVRRAGRGKMNPWIGAGLGTAVGAIALFASGCVSALVPMALHGQATSAILEMVSVLWICSALVGGLLGFCIGGITRGLILDDVLQREAKRMRCR